MIDILLAEDQTILRDALASLMNGQPDMRVTAWTANADDAPALCQRYRPHLAVLDVVTENIPNGIPATARIRTEYPDVKIVVITAVPEINFIAAAQKAGAHSFVYKNSDSSHLLHVIRATMDGENIYPASSEYSSFVQNLSADEIAIIRLVCQGNNRGEIARKLKIHEMDVKARVSGILARTGFDSIMKLSIYAVSHGFILPGVHPGTTRTSRRSDHKGGFFRLTRREEEVLRLVAKGMSNAQIALKLDIVVDTVKKNLNSVFLKLNARNRVDAVRKYWDLDQDAF